jgi:3-oxoacyl-[acyl-carrier-protein] synthase III
MRRSVIAATGSYIPANIVKNTAFEYHHFFEDNGAKMYRSNKTIIEKFKQITAIEERRYASEDEVASDLAFHSATCALDSANINKDTLDYIIVAHNFGDVTAGSNRTRLVPSLSAKVKSMLKIESPECIAYDLIFGCAGWIQGMIQADYLIRSGDANRCLVIGTETLSRIIDPHDRDSMIYGDGSGAVILEAADDGRQGILAHKTRTYANGHTALLGMDKSNSPFTSSDDRYLKMQGRKVYEFALSFVPDLILDLLQKAKLTIGDIDKILIHQANAKMDESILRRLFTQAGLKHSPASIMPMTISWLGNSSVATVPTLLDLVATGKMDGHQFKAGEKIIMVSLGAGMNISALIYEY